MAPYGSGFLRRTSSKRSLTHRDLHTVLNKIETETQDELTKVKNTGMSAYNTAVANLKSILNDAVDKAKKTAG